MRALERRACVALALWLSSVAACSTQRGGPRCAATSDCAPEQTCSLGFCAPPCDSDWGCRLAGLGNHCTAERACVIAPPPDVSATDAARDARGQDVVLDAGPVCYGPSDGGADASGAPSPCDAVTEVMGAQTPLGLVARADSRAAPAAGLLDFSGCASADAGAPSQVAFRYTMRSDGFLVVDTLQPGTSVLYDNMVGIFPCCSGQVSPLACNDNYEDDSRARVSTGQVLAAGTSVLVAVAGRGDAVAPSVTQGPVEALFRELAPVAPGQPCEVTGQLDRCVGSVCALVREGVGYCYGATAMMAAPNPGNPQFVVPIVVLEGSTSSTQQQVCFAFDAPHGASLVAEVSDGARGCNGGMVAQTMTLYSGPATGLQTVIARASGSPALGAYACAKLDGTRSGPAHALEGGRYSLCLQAQPPRLIAHYFLSLALVLP